VVDAKAGLTSADQEVGELLRRSAKPTILVANKVDNDRRILDATEFYELGLGDPRSVSAINSAGSGELLDEICDMLPLLPAEQPEDTVEPAIRVALIGRPNVGKSALVNAILGEDRVIVSDIAGTTRDAIDTPFRHDDVPMVLIDTAGIRRPGRLEGSIEHYSVMRSKSAVERADVAVVVFDASDRMKAQDLHIMGLALDAYTGIVMCGNKWDLAREGFDKVTFTTNVKRRIEFATWVPIVATSAVEGTGLDELLTEVKLAATERKKRVQTSELNALMRGALARRPPPLISHKRLKLLYVTEVRIDPPTFVFFVNDAELVPTSYQRYLENALRRSFGYRGTAIRMIFRSRSRAE
jgi:GTP-binding protein